MHQRRQTALIFPGPRTTTSPITIFYKRCFLHLQLPTANHTSVHISQTGEAACKFVLPSPEVYLITVTIIITTTQTCEQYCVAAARQTVPAVTAPPSSCSSLPHASPGLTSPPAPSGSLHTWYCMVNVN